MNACDESLVSASKGAGDAERSSAATDAYPQPAASGGSAPDRWLLMRLRGVLGNPAVDFAVRDSARITCSAAPVASVTFASRATLLSILTDPWVRFGDAYSAGDVQIDGDLVWLLEAVYRAGGMGSKRESLLRRALALRHRNTLASSRDNIPHPYTTRNRLFACSRQGARYRVAGAVRAVRRLSRGHLWRRVVGGRVLF